MGFFNQGCWSIAKGMSLAVVLAFQLFNALADAEPRQAEANATPSSSSAVAFSAAWLEDHASALASQPYQTGELDPDNPLRQLSYDDYRRIVFDPEQAIWAKQDLPFQLQLFHPGFLANSIVQLNLVSSGQSEKLAFNPELFDYQPDLPGIDPGDAGGYAGFRAHFPINSSARVEEFLVFLGASYFRAVAKDQFYGLSARGLAINTVGDGPEEFPRFSEFWVERPAPGARDLTIHALLDSPSVTGAYHFSVLPGPTTQVDVEMVLFPRRAIERVGLAPLTSMFLFDANDRGSFDDFRRAVHDSDGLLIQRAGGERLWRPLSNPGSVQVSSFGMELPIGFGLLQRHQEFEQFQDAEARYEKRPSLWIEPQGDWGDGEVMLIEIPTGQETNDNIVAFWQPSGGLSAERSYRYAYRMHWGQDPNIQPLVGRVVETAAGAAAFGEQGDDVREFVIDYSGGEQLSARSGSSPGQPARVRINAWSSTGRLSDVSGTVVEPTGNYRVYLKWHPQGAELAEFRVALEVDGQQWGETWLYRWTL